VGDPGIKINIKIKLDNPHEVGADRIATTVAAYKRYGGDLIVIDFGTATTFHVIDKRGSLIGGAIAPGIDLAANALHSAAAKLPKIAIEKPKKVIGNATIPAMQTGIYWGYVGLVEGIISRMRNERKIKMRTVATGGLSNVFLKATDILEYHDPNLIMYGLLEIYKLNKE
jgi:type III pantothenate kinase